MGFDMGAIQHNLFGWLGRRRDRLEYLLPNSGLAPAGETIVDRLGGAVFLWAVDPAAPHFEHVHDPAQNPPKNLGFNPLSLFPEFAGLQARPLIFSCPA
jgi:hypothetical protein